VSRCRLTRRARDGLDRIVASVEARFGPSVTDRVLDSLLDALVLLSEHPRAGHRREDITDDENLLFWSVGPTLIAYRPTKRGLEVVAVERANVDWSGILDHL
jgi:plasmid stabilization system protein ParE